MLTKNSKRVIIIDKVKSDMIEQAIFILRGNEGDEALVECGIVAEAQGIIENYIRKMSKARAGERAARLRAEKKKPLLAYFVITAATMVLFALAIYAMGIM